MEHDSDFLNAMNNIFPTLIAPCPETPLHSAHNTARRDKEANKSPNGQGSSPNNSKVGSPVKRRSVSSSEHKSPAITAREMAIAVKAQREHAADVASVRNIVTPGSGQRPKSNSANQMQ